VTNDFGAESIICLAGRSIEIGPSQLQLQVWIQKLILAETVPFLTNPKLNFLIGKHGLKSQLNLQQFCHNLHPPQTVDQFLYSQISNKK
jgi:hypothetical protein